MKEVRSVPFEQVKPWLKKKHYAKRVPSISYAFGLYIDGVLSGVVSYGVPASNALTKGLCGEEYADKVLELNRLVVETGIKNSASYLVGKSLRLLPKQTIVVSYADTGQGHVGYIYQATNFIYTGLSDRHVEWEIGKDQHSRHLVDEYGGINRAKEILGDKMVAKERSRKHRYVYFVGCNKKIKDSLKYPIKQYPKGESKRYDAGAKLEVQGVLL